MLPQGFKNSPTLFWEILAKHLRELQLTEGTLLQYVDDILIATLNEKASNRNTFLTLNFLAESGYKVSQKKAQISQPKVKYLGLELSQGQRSLLPDRREGHSCGHTHHLLSIKGIPRNGWIFVGYGSPTSD